MSFYNLKNALFKRGGIVSADENTVSFFNGKHDLSFSGTGDHFFNPENGVEHEYVSVKLDGEEFEDLSLWLSDKNPRLRTGNYLIRYDGVKTGCIKICELILKIFQAYDYKKG